MPATFKSAESRLTKKGRRMIANHQQSLCLDCLNQTAEALDALSIPQVQQLMFELWVALYGLRYLKETARWTVQDTIRQGIEQVYGADVFSTQAYFQCFSNDTLTHWLEQLWLDDWGPMSIDVLGICYEQGLDLELQHGPTGFDWTSSRARGNQGAYFTPPQLSDFLVRELIDAALPDASVDELTALRICDPACGAGAFLRAALRLLLKRLGDVQPTPSQQTALAECLYGVDLDKNATVVASISIWLTLGGKTPELLKTVRRRFVCGDALLMGAEGEGRAQHKRWSDVFPKVFKRGGFDVIVGNPPYLSAMTGGLSKELKASYRHAYPRLSGRADLSAYFWDLATRLCQPKGLIGLVLPRPLLGAAACAELRNPATGYWPRMIYSPEHYAFFDDVNIKIMCLMLGPKGPCRISNSDSPDKGNWRVVDDFHSPWEYTQDNWWAPFTLATTDTTWPKVPSKRLSSEGFTVRAGIGPVDFYKIKLVNDPTASVGPKLIVSGLIDPNRCDWGKVPARYKGALFLHPCVDTSGPLSSSLKVHLEYAKRPKLILANLVTRLECMLDKRGDCIGATATYCIFEDEDNVNRLKWLCQILHQADSTRLFRLALGANAMHSNLSIRSGFLKSFPIPPRGPQK